MSTYDLSGKVAVITGASRGIGRAIAIAFAQAGADVVVTARSIAALEETAEKVREEGRKAVSVPTDVTDVDSISNMLTKTLDEFGKVDILVNNAGGDSGGTGYVRDLSFEAWRDGIELNLNSIFYCCKIMGEVMIQQKSGTIINISSGMGFGPFPGAAHHAAAKAGVINFTKTLALELGPFNVRVTGLAPGYTKTALPSKRWDEHPEELEALLKTIPSGRIAQPEEMAAMAVFLASSFSSYIFGETIYASGGMTTTVSPSWIDYAEQIRNS